MMLQATAEDHSIYAEELQVTNINKDQFVLLEEGLLTAFKDIQEYGNEDFQEAKIEKLLMQTSVGLRGYKYDQNEERKRIFPDIQHQIVQLEEDLLTVRNIQNLKYEHFQPPRQIPCLEALVCSQNRKREEPNNIRKRFIGNSHTLRNDENPTESYRGISSPGIRQIFMIIVSEITFNLIAFLALQFLFSSNKNTHAIFSILFMCLFNIILLYVYFLCLKSKAEIEHEHVV